MARLALYQYPGGRELASMSPPCLKIGLALRRLGLEHELRNLKSPAQVRQISPTGRVPVLEIDGRRVVESVRILDMLQPLDPRHLLFPADPLERARDRVWDCLVTDSLYWIGVYHRWVIPEYRERLLDAIFGSRRTPVRSVSRWFVTRTMRRRTAAQGVGSRSRPDVEDALERFLDMANESLAGGPFLEGRASPGRGDLSLAALLAQVGWRQTMPAVLASVRTRGALHAHVGCVFEACGLQRPAGFAEADHSPLT